MLERDFSHPHCECFADCECDYEGVCTCPCDCEPEPINVIVGRSAETQGYLPFYAVDTLEEVDALIELALERGEFFQDANGTIIEATLSQEQTLENLELAGDRLHALHQELLERNVSGTLET